MSGRQEKRRRREAAKVRVELVRAITGEQAGVELKKLGRALRGRR